jgi:hypothetical protein
MLKVAWKPEDEIRYSLRHAKTVSILACDGCAKVFGAGGDVGMEYLKDLMAEWGKEVVFADIIPACCFEDFMRMTLMKDPDAISRSDAVLVDSCASGVKAAYLCDPTIPAVAVLDTMGSAIITQQDSLLARSLCRGCGHCVITYTGGICPPFECPLGTKYGPCEDSPVDGTQCAIDPSKECVWVKIGGTADRNALQDLDSMHGAGSPRSSDVRAK